MAEEKSDLQKRIQTGRMLLLAEIWPPCGSDPLPVREAASRYAGKVHALGVSDNRDRVGMSALAAASVVASQGVEPILNVVTRDRNRIALVSDYLGARALGIGNLLCTTGNHQTLGRCRAAKNVFDLDCIQLLRTYRNLRSDGSVVGEQGINGSGPVCLGAVATPQADPIEMQLMRLAKKVSAGAEFLITQPVFDLERFDAWWKLVADGDLHRQVAMVAGIQPLGDAESAASIAARRPSPGVPDRILQRITSVESKTGQRARAIGIAVETIQRLSQMGGLRGFCIRTDGDTDAALEILDKAGLKDD